MRSLVIFLAGCSTPATLRLSPETIVVYESGRIDLPEVEALDSRGQAIENAPAPAWTVEPASVASLTPDGSALQVSAAGSATLTATVRGITANVQLEALLPDSLDLTVPGSLVVGDEVTFEARARSDETDIDPDAITCAVDRPELAELSGRRLLGLEEGTVALTCKIGKLSKQATVTVTPDQADVGLLDEAQDGDDADYGSED